MKNLQLMSIDPVLIFVDELNSEYWSDGGHLYIGDKGNKNMLAKGEFSFTTGEFKGNGMKNQKIKIIQ